MKLNQNSEVNLRAVDKTTKLNLGRHETKSFPSSLKTKAELPQQKKNVL